MAPGLTAFLYARAEQSFAWGTDDCCLFLADWWREVRGEDPAAALRGTYGSEDECRALVVAAGGLPPLVARLAAQAGAEPTDHPIEGDVAVIAVADKQIGAIHAGRFWAIRNERVGFLPIVRVKVVQGWRV